MKTADLFLRDDVITLGDEMRILETWGRAFLVH